MPWISDVGRHRVQLLSFEHPRAGAVRLPSEDVLDGHVDWRLYLAALGHPAPVTTAEIMQVVPDLPLPVVDDFIDLGLIGKHELPWRHRQDPEERLYLRARLVPEHIGREEAAALGWTEMERRHRFLEGEDLFDGDDLFSLLAALWRGEDNKSLRALLTPEARALYNQIIDGVQQGHWPEHIITDRSLWGLLSALWIPSDLINPKLSEFHAWRALCNCYRWVLVGWFDKAKPQIERLLEAAHERRRKGKYRLPDAIRAEIYTMGAYLAQETNELEFAIKLLELAKNTHVEVRKNLLRLQDRRATVMNDRDHWENPYLMLGIPHGYPDWEEQWRYLRRDLNHDVDRLTHINAAKRRLAHAERHGSDFYVIPLDKTIYQLSEDRSAKLLPDIEALQRQTRQSRPEDMAQLRNRSVKSILADFQENLPQEMK
ncbi:hypothetical protein PS9374_04176 [Planomonospora sphaerica]|uniref:Uncharacterized protein n=2 Tax=Planomonospora sphaerica TaxID=161355 RepID=A0A171DHH9_9ACTN|nr:hypothetical protein PS9374_04176 [Planomonospora sphaerica]